MATTTVGRWIKSVLSSASIDSLVFNAHSVMDASVINACINRDPVAEILRTADLTTYRTLLKREQCPCIISETVAGTSTITY